MKRLMKEHLHKMDEQDYANAGKMVNDLLDDIGANDNQNNIFDIIERAVAIDPHGIEVNGDKFERIENDKVVVYDYPEERHIARQDIDWIRVEGYGGKSEYNGAYIMYVYLHLNKSRSIIDKDNIQFDYYPDPDTDDYVDSVNYKDCLKYLGKSRGLVKEASEGFATFYEEIKAKADKSNTTVDICDNEDGTSSIIVTIKHPKNYSDVYAIRDTIAKMEKFVKGEADENGWVFDKFSSSNLGFTEFNVTEIGDDYHDGIEFDDSDIDEELVDESHRPSVDDANMQVNDFLEKIGDYLMVDFDVKEVEKYKFGPRIIFEKDGARYYVEVGYTDNQPMD